MAKLYMLLIGASPKGRNIEQHDIFFGIGENIRDILPLAADFWPEAGSTLHLDAWREVTKVDDFKIEVLLEKDAHNDAQLFFINLGGYKAGEFEEFHYKMLAVGVDKGAAVKQSKETAFYKHTGFRGATSHIDDKYGIDVDDFFAIKDILPKSTKENYTLQISPTQEDEAEDKLHLGYFIPGKVDRWAPL